MIMTYIDGIPLYTTIEEAEAWASNYSITGYHTHEYQGQTGYMGGTSHVEIDEAINSGQALNRPATTPLTSFGRVSRNSGY